MNIFDFANILSIRYTNCISKNSRADKPFIQKNLSTRP